MNVSEIEIITTPNCSLDSYYQEPTTQEKYS